MTQSLPTQTAAVAPTTLEAPPRRFQVVLVLGLLISLGPLSIDMYLPAFPEISDEFTAAESQVQLTLTGMLLGLAFGQLVIGPLSDAFGRKRPLVVGLSVHALASVLCLLAPSVEVLAGVRIVQGFAGAAVTVTAMAMVRDQFAGIEVARTMSRLMLVMGAAPMLAPTLGSQVLRWSDWRGIFGVLAVVALALVTLALFALRETLPPARRRPARVRASLATYRSLLADRAFLAVALIGGLMMAAMFSYIAGSSYVFQDGFGASEQQFAVIFGLNALALITATQVNPTLLRRWRIMDVMTAAMVVSALASTSLVVLGATGVGGIAGAVVPLVVVLACNGLVSPNVPALALNRHGEAAGSAAAVLGFLQFGIGGAVAPVVGLFDSVTTVPMGVVMASVVLTALALMVFVVRRDEQVRTFA
ncbi:multidrug effflux MFS transporter [Nocardioides sp. AE5]|uniref:multidrug effflux MFS transporter n=1 Tax=Nocardioides sp. AE5 TaxID=2962573 RepID=UPI0028812959|nr:multidrug effflux MFS transporter [Nocardioides sp. AE5]MDT0200985.1 multidrug effflux MFS transporter [Nocardioides sp. AE5]